MKKTIITLLVLCCAFALFAADNAVNFSVAPYVFQVSTSTTHNQTPKSTYGVGAEVSYRRYLVKGLYAEAQFGWDYFLYKNKENKNFNNVMYSALVGYNCNFASKWSMDVHAGVADDTLVYAKEVSKTVTVKTGLGASYQVTDNLAATLKVDGTFGFAKDYNGTHYVNYRVVSMMGCTYSF